VSTPVIPDAERQLKRDIGFFGAAFLAFNGTIAAGIFALPGTLNEDFGAFSPWLFPIFGILILVIAIPFARMASHFPVSGGPVRYTAAFGPFVSFQVGWLYWVARVAAIAANLNLFATYASSLWPPLGESVGRIALILVMIAALALLNVVGLRRAMRFLHVVTLAKALPLLAAVLIGLWMFADQIPAPGPIPPLSGLEGAALLVLYAFVGFESAVLPAGETKDAGRTLPRALIGTLVVTIVFYLLIQLAYVAAMPAGPAPEAPMMAFGEQLAGPLGALALTVCALLSILGNVTSIMTAAPRVTFALAVDRLLPPWFARVHPRFATPANAVIFTALVVAALALSGSFVWLAVASTLARLIVYSASIAALPGAERRARKRSVTALALIVPALVLCGWGMLQAEWPQWRMLLGLALVGTLLFAIALWQRRRTGDLPQSAPAASEVDQIDRIGGN
jgi:APA family basic amino acid/polyamine antiporter